ncbi:hypothetical protein AUI51_02255 [archaeon 13_1_40CM_2_52_4]|nr:MAG: hypothetical protein AUI51_02255 [archaeon 13_1_40CM_2_52_4]
MMFDQISNRSHRPVVQGDARVVGQTKLLVFEDADGVSSVSRFETLVAAYDNGASWKINAR